MYVVCVSGGIILEMKGRVKTLSEGKETILKVLDSGEALEKFHLMLICQGVAEVTATTLCRGDMWSVLPSVSPTHITIIRASSSGNVQDRIMSAIVCYLEVWGYRNLSCYKVAVIINNKRH
jgi:thymidine phosphorylase